MKYLVVKIKKKGLTRCLICNKLRRSGLHVIEKREGPTLNLYKEYTSDELYKIYDEITLSSKHHSMEYKSFVCSQRCGDMLILQSI